MSEQNIDDITTQLVPALRADIKISASAASHEGAPMWVIHDPLQHRYFQINRETKEVISIWQEGSTVGELVEFAENQLKLDIEPEQITRLVDFLRYNSLLSEPDKEGWEEISNRANLQDQSFISKVLKNYVFFKIPLVRPQSALNAAMPWVSFFFSRVFVCAVLLSGLVGFYLVSRQWDGFVGHFLSFLTLQGLAYFGLALIVLKALHELGHAFTATRYGVQVPTMGVAFFLLTPLLFTDVSDAWRLSSRRKRLIISAAGIIVELMVACLATLAWVFLPDGIMRDSALIFATTGWMMSLIVNLNPLIKFDGYYLLSDMLGIDNLQPRSFLLGKWKMRQLLFAPDLPAPEQLSSKMRKGLIVFAWMTWVYRVILFTTIALVVYHFAFKALGILLLIIEVWLLVARPIFKELVEWYKLGASAASPMRLAFSLSVFACLGLIFVMPWSTRIEIPAVMEAAGITTIYPGRSAKIINVHVKRGDLVKKDDVIAQLLSPALEHEIAKTKIDIATIKRRLANGVVKGVDRERLLVLRQSFKFEAARLVGLLDEKSELSIKAPFAGVVRELNRGVHSGRWIDKNEHIGLIVASGAMTVRGYLDEDGLRRVKGLATGKFIPDDITRSVVSVALKSVAKAASSTIDIAQLASLNGGGVGVAKNGNNLLIPLKAQYLLELEPQFKGIFANQVVRGVVVLKGEAESLWASTWKHLAKVLVRESSF